MQWIQNDIILMFLSRNSALRWLIRHSRDLSKKPPTQADDIQPSSAQTPQGVPQDPVASEAKAAAQPSKMQKIDFDGFPYKFGGVRNYGTSQSVIELILPEQKPSFYQLYLNLIKAISSKNQSKLSELVQVSMIKALLRPEIHSVVLNGDNPGRVLYHDFSIGMGMKFVREQHSGFTKQTTPDNTMHMYAPSSFNPTKYILSGNIPMLISINTTIISKTKLGLQGQEEDGQEEAHSLTFQCESKLVMSNMMGIMAALPSLQSNPDLGVLRKLLFTDQKHEWRIGNIDKHLKNRYD